MHSGRRGRNPLLVRLGPRITPTQSIAREDDPACDTFDLDSAPTAPAATSAAASVSGAGSGDGTLQSTLARWLRSIGISLRPHAVSLAVVALAVIIGQAATLSQHQLAYTTYSDTLSYFQAAQAIAKSPIHLLAPIRTPAFPLLLLIVLSVMGWTHFNAIVHAQMVLLVVAIFESYALVFHLTRRRVVAVIIASLLATNLYVLSWERVLLSELLAIVAIITTCFFFERFLRRPNHVMTVGLTAALILTVMTRPNYVYLPALLLIAALGWSLWTKRLAEFKRPLLASGALLVVVIGGYMAGHALGYGGFGLTTVSNQTLLGKILEYHMQDENTDPRYAQLRQDLDSYIASGQWDPWGVYWAHPKRGYDAHYFAIYGPYSTSIILSHPVEYTLKSLPDIYAVWRAQAILYPDYGTAPDGSLPLAAHAVPGITGYPYFASETSTEMIAPTYEPVWVTGLLALSTVELASYLLLPILLLVLALVVWRGPRRVERFALLVIAAVIATNIILTGFVEYTEFYRIRCPVDPLMILVAGVVLYEALTRVPRLLRRGGRDSAAADAGSRQEPVLVR